MTLPAEKVEPFTDWVLVPREPTVDMEMAGVDVFVKFMKEGQDLVSFDSLQVRTYRAMLAAAPAPSGAQSEREALAPCPFCGAAAYWESHAQIECSVCPAKIGMFIEHDDGGVTRAAVLKAWQARASAGSARVDAREAIAEIIYDAMRFERFSETEGWIKNGNSLAQDRARRASGRILAAHIHSAPPALTDALAMLHDDVADYARINNLGGYGNHAMKAARAALRDAGIHRVECPNCGGDHVFTDCPRKEKGAATNDGPSAATKIAT